MPSIIPKNYFCPKCKKEITKKVCDCGTKGKPQPPYSVRFRWVDEGGIVRNLRITDEIGKGWQTQAAAQRGYDDWITAHPSHKKVDKRIVDFLPLYEEYKAHLRANVKESSYLTFVCRMDGYVVPYFRKMRVTEIKRSDIVKWQNSLADKPLSSKYKKEIRGAFYHFFNYLAIYGINNPIIGVKGFKTTEKKKEMLFWTQEEFEKFIACVDDFRYKVTFAFLYLTGCRKGEALALRWQDIDLENGIATISGTLTKATDKERNANEGEMVAGPYRLTTPKTQNSYRKVLMPTVLTDYLKSLKNISTSDFVFGANGTVVSFTTLRNVFRRYIEIAGVKMIRIHDLRHSHVSLLINKGDSQLSTLYVIAARIGDSVEMVLKTYGHMFPNQQKDLIARLNINLS